MKINNTNVAGFGDSILAMLDVSRSTTPRFVKASASVFSAFGRFPLAFAVANMASINDIKVDGVSVPASSFITLNVAQPFDLAKLGSLQNAVKSLFPKRKFNTCGVEFR